MTITQPLDLYQLLVNQLAGSFDIFIFLSITFLAILAAIFKMPNIVFGGLLIVYASVLFSAPEGPGSDIAGLMLLGIIIIAMMVANILRRQTSS